MEDILTVRDVDETINGEYKFDAIAMLGLHGPSPEALTMGELHQIKKQTGLRAGELTEALVAGDTDAYVGLATIVLERGGKTFDHDLLWNAPHGNIEIDFAKRNPEKSPPANGHGTENVGQPVSSDPPDVNNASSGDDSQGVSENQVNDLEPIGHPA
jgi:hypothetical protein